MVIRPSALAITVACAGSVALQASVLPLPDTYEIAEGHAGHFIANRYAAGFGSQFPVNTKFQHGGQEWDVTLDMVTGALMFQRAMGGLHNDLRLEDPLACPEIHEQCHGTPDGWRFFPSYTFEPELIAQGLPAHAIRLIRVGDYKYGHRYVEVYGMYQCIAYVTGVMSLLQLTDNDPYLWVEIIVVQPRSYHPDGPVRAWRVKADQLRAWINHARAAATEAVSAEPTARTNEHCMDCKASHVCRTLQTANYAAADFSGKAEVVKLPPEAIGQELAILDDAINRLEARRKGVAVHAETFLRNGERVSNYHMGPTGSRLKYREGVVPSAVIGLGDAIGVNLRYPHKPFDTVVTPTQAIELGVDASLMDAYAFRPSGGQKLTRDNHTHVGKVFNK